jgi:hypothetical protein
LEGKGPRDFAADRRIKLRSHPRFRNSLQQFTLQNRFDAMAKQGIPAAATNNNEKTGGSGRKFPQIGILPPIQRK